jgi:DnaK suppressor protein
MNRSAVESLMRLLRERRENLWNEAAAIERQSVTATSERESELEEDAQAARDAHLLERLSDRIRREIEEIDAALQRIDDGQCGECAECGEEIALGRLQVLPAARLCVECARAGERGAAASSQASAPPEGLGPPGGTLREDTQRRSDREWQDILLERIRSDGGIDTGELEITCRSRRLLLSGTVPGESEHQILLKIVTNVGGFREIVDRIHVGEVLQEQRGRTPQRSASAHAPEEAWLYGEAGETDDVVESIDEGKPYRPPDTPPWDEEK